MVQIIQERRKPSFSEKLNLGLARGLEQGSKLYEQNQQRDALKQEGINPNLPPEFQQMAYQAKLNKQISQDEKAYDLKTSQKKIRHKIRRLFT